MKRWVPALLVAVACYLSLSSIAWPVAAHPMDAASLTLIEEEPGRFRTTFQASSAALERELSTFASFPASCHFGGGMLECGGRGLVGEIGFPWLEGTLTRLLVDVEWLDGTRLVRVVTAQAPEITVYGAQSTDWLVHTPVLVDYVTLGIEHIAFGFDHLAFVVALTLLVQGRGRLVKAVTAFTASHSVTLAATALGMLSVPSAPVEALIAWSVVLVCGECAKPAETLTRRSPWLVAFAFGLLHGLGFASALLDVGLPERHVPLALFSFNLGVELGQLGVVVILLLGRALLERGARGRLPLGHMARALVYTLGSLAAFWSIERTIAALAG